MENRLHRSTLRSKNSFYTSKSGLNTIQGHGQEEQDIRKSRIEHLPSYRRTDLSGKLQFVVIFQTIEIQRLSLQIESLRVMLKDADRQIRNYLNYQVQIKELTENCHQLEEQRYNYQNQVEKMSLACNSLYQQLNQCKKQNQQEVQQLRKQSFKNGQALKAIIKQLELDNQSTLQKLRQSQQKTKTISQELVRLNQTMLSSQNQLLNLRQKDAKKTKDISNYQQQLGKWQKVAQDQKNLREQQLRVMSAQFNGINQQVLQVSEEKAKLLNLLNQHQKQLDELMKERDFGVKEIESLQKQLQIKEKQSQKLKTSNNELIVNINGFNQAITAQKLKSSDISRFANELKNKIEQKIEQLGKVKHILSQYDKEWQQKINSQKQLTQKIVQLQSLIPVINQLKQEIYNLHIKISQKNNQLANKQQLINDLKNEKEEFIYIKTQLETQRKQLQKYLNQLQNKIQIQRQNNQSQRQKLINQYRKLIEREQAQKNEALKKNETLLKDLQKIKQQGLIKQEMKSQVRRLNQNCKRQSNDIQAMTGRFQNVTSIIKKLKDQQKKLHQLQKTNNVLKNQVSQSLNLNNMAIIKIGDLSQQIETLNDEITNLREKLRIQIDGKDDDFPSCTNSIKTIRSTGICGSVNSSNITSNKDLQSSVKYSQVQSNIQPARPAYNSYLLKDKTDDRVSIAANMAFGGAATQRPKFNAEINISRLGKSNSILQDGVSKNRVLEPSKYLQSRESNYSSVLGSYTQRQSIQRRQKK